MTVDPDNPPTREITVTCRTEGCANNGAALVLIVPDVADPAVICGVCGQPITELREVGG